MKGAFGWGAFCHMCQSLDSEVRINNSHFYRTHKIPPQGVKTYTFCHKGRYRNLVNHDGRVLIFWSVTRFYVDVKSIVTRAYK